MDKKILVRELIEEGEQLIRGLQRNRFPLTAAIWNYFTEPMEWRLVLVSPIVDLRSPMDAYARVQRVLLANNLSYISISDIALISPHSEDFQNLQSVMSAPGRFNASRAGGKLQNVVFEDSYIYPLASSEW